MHAAEPVLYVAMQKNMQTEPAFVNTQKHLRNAREHPSQRHNPSSRHSLLGIKVLRYFHKVPFQAINENTQLIVIDR